MVLSNKEWLDKMNEIISAIKNGGGDSQVIEDMLSNMWISSATYNVGDYVLYDNNIWKCLVQNSNITPSEGNIWTRVNITSEISTLNSNLIKTKEIAVDVTVAENSGILGSYYGYFNITIPSEIINTKIIAFIPISATSITSNGSCGILGLYNADFSSNNTAWTVSTPTSGTYRCRFIIIFI